MSGKPKAKPLTQDPTSKTPEPLYFLQGPIHDGLQVLARGVEQELGTVLQRAYDLEHQLREVLASVTLISRTETMRLLNISEAQLDRKLKAGEIEVTYIDSRPRVRLTELQRYIAVNTKGKAATAPPLPTPPMVEKPARRSRKAA